MADEVIKRLWAFNKVCFERTVLCLIDMMKGALKLKAEDNLAPIRDQMMDLIQPNAKVIEFGCGKGDLLFKLSPQIKAGLGIDKSRTLINYAIQQKKKKHIANVDFLCEELKGHYPFWQTYDVSIASLFFHVIPISEAVYLLSKMREMSDHMLICGFSSPKTLHQKFLLWVDQRFSGHYRHFKAYQKAGYMEGILSETQCSNVITYDTFIPFLKSIK